MQKTAKNNLTLENIIKKSCATKDVKLKIEEIYRDTMNNIEKEGDLEYHKSEILSDMCNLLDIKLHGYRKIMDKYGGM